jgi:hypothetical protein
MDRERCLILAGTARVPIGSGSVDDITPDTKLSLELPSSIMRHYAIDGTDNCREIHVSFSSKVTSALMITFNVLVPQH